MASKVTVKTHTKGKNSQPFEYEAYGKIVIVDTTDRETKEVTSTPTLVSDGAFTSMAEVTAAFNEAFPENTEQSLIDVIAKGINQKLRQDASPGSSTGPVVDELTPIETVLVDGGYLGIGEKSGEPLTGPWRRLVTQSQSNFGGTRIEWAQRTPQYLKALADGKF